MAKETKKDIKTEETVESPVIEEKTTVEIEKDALTKMMDRINRLESAADKAQLARYDDRRRETHVPTYRLRTILDGESVHVILGWKLLTNIVEKNPTTGVWVEDQKVKLFLDSKNEAGEDKELIMDMLVWVQRYKQTEPMELVSQEALSTGQTILHLSDVMNGKTYKIDRRFVN